MAHIGCTAPLAATPVRVRRVHARGLGFGRARGEPGNGTTLTSVAAVGRFCRATPARFISGGMERDISQASLTHTPTSNDASLPAPPVRPGTRRPLLRLLHPELPPGREESAAGGWEQTGLEHHPYIPL